MFLNFFCIIHGTEKASPIFKAFIRQKDVAVFFCLFVFAKLLSDTST